MQFGDGDVEKDDDGTNLSGQCQALSAERGGHDPQSLSFQESPHQVLHLRVVAQDEDRRKFGALGRSAGGELHLD